MLEKLGLAILFFALSLQAQTYIVPDLQRDDFTQTSLDSWWKSSIWPPNSTEHHLTVNGAYLKADLVNPLDGASGGRLQSDYSGMENVGFASATDRVYNKEMVIDVTMRVRTLNALPVGSRGWGTWRSEGVPVTVNQSVWFMEQKAHPDSSWASTETWWRARTERGVDDQNDKYTDLTVDNTLWHTYRVVRYSDGTSSAYYDHYIDGTLVQHITPADFDTLAVLNEDYEFHCWNDNLVYHFIDRTSSGLPDTIEVFYNGWIDTSSFLVDFVEIRKNGYDPSYEVAPTDDSDFLRLRSYESEIDDGTNDGLWKSYSFDTFGGNTYVVITAKAETYDGYQDDDDLKVVIDGSDYGYDNANSWNGDTDDGLPKTLVFTPTLNSGSHTLELYSQTTPILYDVNVLSATDGSLVLDQTLNETAPSGSNDYLWKSFSFDCDAGPVAIYVSASADHESGWDYLNADIDSTDDDELRIMLDNTDFGWGGSNGFVGNALHGDVKTVLIKDTLAAGSHTLKLYANETPTVFRVIVFAQNGDYSLPVALSQFNASLQKNEVRLQWKTESEVNNMGFHLFRAVTEDSVSPAENAFSRITTSLIPGQGSSPVSHTYVFVDSFGAEQNRYLWYRLQSIDLNGSKHTLATTVVHNVSTAVIQAFRLFPNFPNPFNPATTIHFVLPEMQKVTVEIFDVQGRKVRLLWDGDLPAGEHRLLWNGRTDSGLPLSSGLYWCRVRTGDEQHLHKMVLLK